MVTSNLDTLLLTGMQFCHIIDNNSGIIRLIEGPFRGSLESNEEIYGEVESKIIVNEGQYAIINNPFSTRKNAIVYGDKEIRIGPSIFSLYPEEILENDSIYNEHILEVDQGLIITATRDFIENEVERKAGTSWIIEGPTKYIPSKYEQVIQEVAAISLGLNQGIYIKNKRTGQIRLESGPKSILLSQDELLYKKEYNFDEIDALNLDISAFDASYAIPLNLLKSEMMLIITENSHRIESGPKIVQLGPMEKIFILNISGSTPKIPKQLKLWKIFLGPVFVSDILTVRTKDNAELSIHIRYKTQFNIKSEVLERIFSIKDFIGFATETLGALIRQIAAQYTFESFHSQAALVISKEILFSNDRTGFYEFSQNGFQIFDIDIKKILPKDEEIAKQLNEAIKSNMEVYVKKIHQTAELEAERQLVQGQIEIERSKKELIALIQENEKAKKIGSAQIEALAMRERAKGEAESIELIETIKSEMKILEMQKSLSVLNNQGAEEYIRLQQVNSFTNVEKTVVVPSESQIFMPLGNLSSQNKKLLAGK